MTDVRFPPPIDPDGTRHIAPTDISQFIRLDQCRRYLRLRLHVHAFDPDFMRDYDVAPQKIPALLTRSGAAFEDRVEHEVQRHYVTYDFARETGDTIDRPPDNQRVVELAANLPPGGCVVVFQPRLHVVVHGWLMRGDIDILRMERDADGRLRIMIADMKSSTTAKVEHRVQVAFYHAMLSALLDEHAISVEDITMAVLYRGPSDPASIADEEERRRQAEQRAAAARLFGTTDGLLEMVDDPEQYLRAVAELVTDPDSVAQQVAGAAFAEIPFHLNYKCDGCLYNEFCMKWSAEHDDLSLIPHLNPQEKSALRRSGVTTTRALAGLKQPVDGRPDELVPAPGQERLVGELAAAWPVGPRLDELVYRARRYRAWRGDPVDAPPFIPSKGYGSLPYCDANHNPNLVRIYIDAQHDYVHDRVYLLGALVVASEAGQEPAQRRRSVVHMTAGPPDTAEREADLFVRWIEDVLQSLAEVAAPDEDGLPRAPIHLIFYDALQQRILLDGLSRQFAAIVAATPLFDFITQIAAFDSPMVTFLEHEIRELRNYPMVCQSLHAVAAQRGFDWNQPEPYRRLFHTRMFDFWRKLEPDARDERDAWYTSRARFNSFIPLEYAYAAWGELGDPEEADMDAYRRFHGVTAAQIAGFQRRRLEALEHVAKDFRGNKQTQKSAFHIPSLSTFEGRARRLAEALHEFLTIERHVTLASWKTARLAPPERRALAGETLVVRYVEEDQEPGVAAQNRVNAKRAVLREQYRAAYRAANPDAKQVKLSTEQNDASKWDQEGMRFWLRVETDGIDCGVDELLALSTIREGAVLVLFPRWAVDTRLPPEEQYAFTPTAKQMLYGMRVALDRITIERDDAGRAGAARVRVVMRKGQGRGQAGYVFSTMDTHYRPLEPGKVYTLDPDPNDWYGSHQVEVVNGLIAGGRNTLHDRLVDPATASVEWPPAAAEAQQRFLDGLDALHAAGALHDFEPGKRDYVGSHGDAPILLVQGPPGTGKSYSTAFAIFARLQGALAAGIPYRVFLSCKTHAATDVLLENARQAQAQLAAWQAAHPQLFAAHFDARLLDVPLFRLAPRGDVTAPIVPLPRNADKPPGQPGAVDAIMAQPWCVAGAAPAGTRGVLKDKWPKELFGHDIADCLILDEASQMNLPEAIMAALPLKPDGRVIVVGDHRQMPPIVMHNWADEPRRTFQEYRSYASLFETLQGLELSQDARDALPIIRFEESFRLHADMAEFLRREIYHRDGIAFHSRRTELLDVAGIDDSFVAAALAPAHPLVVIVHDESESQLRNDFEHALIAPVLTALAQLDPDGLDAETGLGVVVPHRAQRAALRDGIPCLSEIDPVTGSVRVSAVDTVERFQGDERVAIVYSATESDPQYLATASKFLMDPRRLTVALSRAKRKMIVVASRSVFTIFSADEETFANAQLWKNLLRRTCTVPLWRGTRAWHGQDIGVEVWGNEGLGTRD
jgi:hypothetical protein